MKNKKALGLRQMKEEGYLYFVNVVTLDESKIIHGVAIQGTEVIQDDYVRIMEQMRIAPELAHLHHLKPFVDYKFAVSTIDEMIELVEN
jgi:hypothetical protein